MWSTVLDCTGMCTFLMLTFHFKSLCHPHHHAASFTGGIWQLWSSTVQQSDQTSERKKRV